MKKINIKEAKKIMKKYPEYIKLVLNLNLLAIISILKDAFHFVKKRFKSYVFWASVASFVYVTLEQFGFIKLTPDSYENIITTLLTALVFYGVIHDPTPEEKDKTVVEKDGDMISISSVPATKKAKGKKAWKNKFRNYALWISIASLIALFVPRLLGVEFPLGDWKIFVESVLSILVIFGIINNPNTDNGGWADDSI